MRFFSTGAIISDASGNSLRKTGVDEVGLGINESAELDPKGNNVGLTWLTGSALRRERPDTGLDNKVADNQSMCTLGGLYGHCSVVENLLSESQFASKPLYRRDSPLLDTPFQIIYDKL